MMKIFGQRWQNSSQTNREESALRMLTLTKVPESKPFDFDFDAE